jgi:hypothetical protein
VFIAGLRTCDDTGRRCFVAPAAGPISQRRESVMHTRVIVASTTALFALFLTALPAFADTEYAGTPTSLDWRLVVILSALGILAFHLVLERTNRGC